MLVDKTGEISNDKGAGAHLRLWVFAHFAKGFP